MASSIGDTASPGSDTMADIDQMATSAVSVIVPFPVFINIIIEFLPTLCNSRADGRFALVEKK